MLKWSCKRLCSHKQLWKLWQSEWKRWKRYFRIAQTPSTYRRQRAIPWVLSCEFKRVMPQDVLRNSALVAQRVLCEHQTESSWDSGSPQGWFSHLRAAPRGQGLLLSQPEPQAQASAAKGSHTSPYEWACPRVLLLMQNVFLSSLSNVTAFHEGRRTEPVGD